MTDIVLLFIVDEYVAVAKDKFGYGTEQVRVDIVYLMLVISVWQALGMLYWYEYNIDKAVENMPNFCPLKGKSYSLHTCSSHSCIF